MIHISIFKFFIEFVTTLFLFYVLDFWPQGVWALSCLTRDGTHTHCIGRQSEPLDHHGNHHILTGFTKPGLMLQRFFSYSVH